MSSAGVEVGHHQDVIIPLPSQVAGHVVGDVNTILKGNKLIYKPLQDGARGNRESEFYDMLSRDSLASFAPFTPAYHGVHDIKQKDIMGSYLALEDLTVGIPSDRLCIADIKMGTQTYDDHASDKKRKAEEEKCKGTTTLSHGFRICGMRVYEEGKGIVKYERSYGKKLSAEDLPRALQLFAATKPHLLPLIVEKLKQILHWFENENTAHKFYGTSILIVFNAESSGAEFDDVIVKIIDFAHVCESKDGSRDQGYIFGLKNLIQTCISAQTTIDRA